jgi:hypothetical protein
MPTEAVNHRPSELLGGNPKISINRKRWTPCRGLLAVKLERTDTTLDLSHLAKEAEERMRGKGRKGLYRWWWLGRRGGAERT